MGWGAFFKDRLLLERPGGGIRQFPIGMPREERHHLAKIGLVVRPEEKACTAARPSRDRRKERGRDDTVLVMPALGPGVWEKDEDGLEVRVFGARGEIVLRLRADEVQVSDPPPLSLAFRPSDALRGDVDADAKLQRMGLRVGRQKMSMAGADLPDIGCLSRDQFPQQVAERLTAILDEREALREAVCPYADGFPSLPASMATMRRLMSVGFTPLIRLA